jgi:flagellar biogenesis protein FliO
MKPGTQASQSAIPFKRESASAEPSLSASAIALLLVSLIAIVAVLVIRKRLRMGQPLRGRVALLQVLETQRLGPRALVSVVSFNNTHYLLAHSEQGITCIATAPAGERQ